MDNAHRPSAKRLPGTWIGAILLALAVALASVIMAGPVQALPPGGAQPNTPGTKSTISPKSVRAGGRVNFTLRGYPGGETVYVKFDDGGSSDGDQSIQGQGVVHQQKIPKSGTVSGSVKIPNDLANGTHWMRYLASETVPGKGSKGYTNRSPNFTVTGSANTTGKKSKAGGYAKVNGDNSGTTTKKTTVVGGGSKGSSGNSTQGAAANAPQAGANQAQVPGAAGGQAGAAPQAGSTEDQKAVEELGKQNELLAGELSKRDNSFPWMGLIGIMLAFLAVVTMGVAFLARPQRAAVHATPAPGTEPVWTRSGDHPAKSYPFGGSQTGETPGKSQGPVPPAQPDPSQHKPE